MSRLMMIPAALLFVAARQSTSPYDDNGALVWRHVGQQTPQAPKFTIRAGPVANAEANAVSGTFQVHRAGVSNGIPSSRLAGGCLIFSAADLGYGQMAAKQCHKDADCSTPGENEFGTCDTKTKQCWSKPAGLAAGAALCRRGIVAAVDELYSVPAQPVDVRLFGIQPGASVRVGACLNKSGINPAVSGCVATDGPDRIFDLGPIRKIK
jgi:hypothetical protein